MHKNVFFFTNFLLNRRNISSTYDMLMKTQWNTKEQIHDHQIKRLKEIIDYTSKNVPFYQRRYKSIGLEPGDIKDFSDFKKIPTLSRQDIIDNHVNMVDVKFLESLEKINPEKHVAGRPKSFSLFRKHKLIMNTSSGSTGAPTVFYEDGTQTGLNWANELRVKSWFGADPGSKEVRFLRSSSEEISKSLIASFRKSFWDQMLLPGVNLTDADHKRSYERIMEFKPKVLWGFTSAISELAKYMIDNKLEIGNAHPNVAITWAAPLYDFEHERIETAFKCKVTNIYGTREVGHIAAKCPSGNFHTNQELLYVETNDADASENSDTKEILCTTLVKVPMPFIRFETGDVGELSDESCECGRPLQILKKLDGRTGEIIFDKDGKMIAPNVWCRFFMEGKLASRINRFQIRYMKNKDIEIKIEKGNGYSPETHDLIVNKFYTLFSNENKLNVTYVDKIQPMKSGKYKMIVNELNEKS